MIADALSRLPLYLATPVWQKVFRLLQEVNAETPEGELPIDGEKAFARVMCYQTLPAAEVHPEAHRKYIDLQMSLDGCEEIDVFTQDGLRPYKAYDERKDIEFFDAQGTIPLAAVTNRPGYFTVLFPQDVHRPKVRVPDEESTVKKIVVKVRID